jgi:hypothetical protein
MIKTTREDLCRMAFGCYKFEEDFIVPDSREWSELDQDHYLCTSTTDIFGEATDDKDLLLLHVYFKNGTDKFEKVEAFLGGEAIGSPGHPKNYNFLR